MTILKKNLLISALLIIADICFAQGNVGIIPIQGEKKAPVKYPWMGTESQMLSDMKLNYKKPEYFYELGRAECFKEYPKLEYTFSCMGNQLHSSDEQCITFMTFPPIYTDEFQKSLEWLSTSTSQNLVDKQHRWQMRAIIKDYYGEIGESWTDSIKHYTTVDAASKFNADSAFYFSLNLRPEDYYKKEFKHVKVLFIQKKGRGYAYICSFFTDKGRVKLDKYWGIIEKILSYED